MNGLRGTAGAAAALALITAGLALAKDKNAETIAPPALFKQLVDCRAIADNAQRLACYDKQVGALQQAQQNNDIVIADKAEIREARKGLFGFSLPNIKLFGSGSAGSEVEELDSEVSAARQNASGQWRIVLTDGAVWEQVDTEGLAIDPRKGTKVNIKRAAFGSYKVKLGGQPPIKMRRVQ